MPQKTKRLLTFGVLALVVVFGVLVALRSASIANDPTHETPTKIAQTLSENGASVERIEESGGAFSSQKSATFFIDSERVTVFFYGSPAEALAIAQQFSSNAQTLAGTPIEWVAPPHFYLRNNAIILYIGSLPSVTKKLEQSFGNQFAGA